MEKAVIYVRSASKDDNRRIEQEIICKDFAKSKGIEIDSICCDFGANVGIRTLLNKLEKSNTGEIKYVIVRSYDRLSRSRNDASMYIAELARHGIKVLSATEQIESENLYKMLADFCAKK